MKKVLISQHYSRNKGNVSVLYTLVENIRKSIPDVEIIVSSFEPVETERLFQYDCCEWPFITRRLVDSHGLKRLWRVMFEAVYVVINVLAALAIRLKLLSASSLRGRLTPLSIIAEVDVVVSPGGHLFTSFNPFPGVFAHFFPCFLASIVKTKYMVMAQTIGPFFGIWSLFGRLLTANVVKHAACITVRDEYSLKNLAEYGINAANVVKTNELVFLYPDPPEESDLKVDRKVFGMTFHHIYFKHWMSKQDYIQRCCKFIEMVMDNFDIKIKFISMEFSCGNRGDVPLLEEIRSGIKNGEEIEILQVDMDPRKVLDQFAHLDFVYATKTHSVIYGLRLKTPTLGIAYDTKTENFMHDFKMDKYCISLKDFEPESAYRIFSDMVQNEAEIKNYLNVALNVIQDQAHRNINLLNELLNG